MTYDHARDGARLDKQREEIWKYVSDGRWHTLGEISKVTEHPEASVSARLRDFRKPRYGGHTVEREYVTRGLWRYRVVVEDRQLSLV